MAVVGLNQLAVFSYQFMLRNLRSLLSVCLLICIGLHYCSANQLRPSSWFRLLVRCLSVCSCCLFGSCSSKIFRTSTAFSGLWRHFMTRCQHIGFCFPGFSLLCFFQATGETLLIILFSVLIFFVPLLFNLETFAVMLCFSP